MSPWPFIAAAGTTLLAPLSSISLQTLHFEITPAPSSSKFSGVATSYYQYLASSLLQGGLPNLTALYVREPNFPDMLLGLAPPTPALADGAAARPASSGSHASGFSGGFGSNSLSPSFPPQPRPTPSYHPLVRDRTSHHLYPLVLGSSSSQILSTHSKKGYGPTRRHRPSNLRRRVGRPARRPVSAATTRSHLQPRAALAAIIRSATAEMASPTFRRCSRSSQKATMSWIGRL